MGDTPQVEYRGFKIIWSDNGDHWWCHELGSKGASNPSLSRLKTKIDEFYRKERHANAVDVYEIVASNAYHRAPEITESRVIEYIEAKTDRSWSKPVGEVIGHMVAVSARRGGNERASRVERELTSLAPSTRETLAAFEEVQRLHLELVEAEKRYNAAIQAIPRLQFQDVKTLADIRDSEPTNDH